MPIKILLDKSDPYGSAQLVPCGKCSKCKQRRISDWVIRLSAEEKQYGHGLFVTLTYDTDHVPITPKGYMTTTKRDVQLFMKRLRKISPAGTKIKYYAAAEYGGRTWRPHYHLIMFGADRELIDKAWGLGTIHVVPMSKATIAYTLKYISKNKRVPQHKNDDRQPEFSLMSKNLDAAI